MKIKEFRQSSIVINSQQWFAEFFKLCEDHTSPEWKMIMLAFFLLSPHLSPQIDLLFRVQLWPVFEIIGWRMFVSECFRKFVEKNNCDIGSEILSQNVPHFCYKSNHVQCRMKIPPKRSESKEPTRAIKYTQNKTRLPENPSGFLTRYKRRDRATFFWVVWYILRFTDRSKIFAVSLQVTAPWRS